MAASAEFLEGLRALVAQVVREELARAHGAPSDQEDYLTTAQAADYSHVSQGTVRRWIREGRLTRHARGRSILVLRSELGALCIPADAPMSRQPRRTADEVAAELFP